MRFSIEASLFCSIEIIVQFKFRVSLFLTQLPPVRGQTRLKDEMYLQVLALCLLPLVMLEKAHEQELVVSLILVQPPHHPPSKKVIFL